MDQKEFNILYYLFKNKNAKNSQRTIAAAVSMSLGTTNAILTKLTEDKLILNNVLTELGHHALEPYKVDNAIIMAAGMSSRFIPLSLEKPKGLLMVKGDVLIEREILQLQEAGISDITIVVGYMKEQFFYLEDKYNVKIVINEDYYKMNNTSSLIRVIDDLKNTYICSSDNYFVDNVFESHVYHAQYSAVYVEGKTDEYCMEINKKGRIENVTIGGTDAWCMLGHVYFDCTFSNRFKEILRDEFETPLTQQQLWEDLYIRYINELDLYIKKYDANKLHEFDSLTELKEFDPSYINNADSSILQNITTFFGCNQSDIIDIEPLKAGMTNLSFTFLYNGIKYVYRHPGIGTSEYINRCGEAQSMKIAQKLNLDDTYLYINEEKGWKLTYYIENARNLDYHNEIEVKQALAMIKKLHDQKIVVDYDLDIWKKTLDFIDKIKKDNYPLFPDFNELFSKMEKLYYYTLNDGFQKCLCHGDCFDPNFIIDVKDKMYLIDWEYSGNDDPATDIGTFVCCSDYTYQEALHIIAIYLGRTPNEVEFRHYLAYISLTAYCWFVWALYQESVGKPVGEYLYIWYKNSKFYNKKAMDEYAKEQ